MNNYKNPFTEEVKQAQNQPQENHTRNNEDFEVYYSKTITINKYIERLLRKIATIKGLNDSTCIRNLIFEEYQKMKREGKIQ